MALRTENGPVVETYIFWNLSVSQNALIERTGTLSILTDSLLAAMQLQLQISRVTGHHDLPPPRIAHLLEGNATEQIGLATTRVPDFSGLLESASNGYRRLVNIRNVVGGASTAPPTNFTPGIEVLAIKADNARSSEYMDMWAPFGPIPHRHFILILISPNTFLSLPATPQRSTSPLSATPISQHSSRHSTPPPSINFFNDSSFTVNSSPAVPVNATTLSNGISPPSIESIADQPLLGALDIPTPNIDRFALVSSVADFLVMAGIAETDVQFDKTNSTNTPLYHLVRNYMHIANLLTRLGCSDLSTLKGQYQPQAGTAIPYVRILESYGWTKSSFDRKRKGVSWCENMAKVKMWDPNKLPGNGNPLTF